MCMDVASVLASALPEVADVTMAILNVASMAELVTMMHLYHPLMCGTMEAAETPVPTLPKTPNSKSKLTTTVLSFAPWNWAKRLDPLLKNAENVRVVLAITILRLDNAGPVPFPVICIAELFAGLTSIGNPDGVETALDTEIPDELI